MKSSIVNLGTLSVDAGGSLLVKHSLRDLAVGEMLCVHGNDPSLEIQLRAFCRAEGHRWIAHTVLPDGTHEVTIERGSASTARWKGAVQAGQSDSREAGSVHDHPPASWGLAPRGAWVEAGGADDHFPLAHKQEVWADDVARMYQQAASAWWDPAKAIPWETPCQHGAVVESAVVQVMTYLIENETAALLVPARFTALVHPHFREVLQLLAIQCADEARHIEVFTRRALLHGRTLGLSTVGGRASLATLTHEPDFSVATFLLSVLGEGTFLSLLRFLYTHAPDPVTREIAKLTGQDEARHVAFGMAHVGRHLAHDPALRSRLISAVERRNQVLSHTAGLNEEVFDALVIIAAQSLAPERIAEGFSAVMNLVREMHDSRATRLRKLGFTESEAETLSSLHTRNFM